MKQLTKKIVAIICIVAMLVGMIVPNGLTLNTKAADEVTTSVETADDTAREWWVYGDDDADTGLVVTDTANGVTSGCITDADVNLPEGLIESNMTLQIKLNVAGDAAALNKASESYFELCNERNDCAELAWGYNTFAEGESTLTFEFKDATHSNNMIVNGTIVASKNNPFDWEETINYFRYYCVGVTSESGVKITISEIKIVYTDAGLTFGADDTYLQLDSAMSATPNAVEATVNMDEIDNRVKWTLREGGDISTFYVESGHELTTGVTTASDEPGEGMTYSILDASTTAVTRFNAINTNLGIDASAYSMEDLAVAFWVYAEKEGTLGTGEQFRIGSTAGEETNAFGTNSLIYYYSNIPVVSGWNYITLPLSDWGDDIQQEFTLSSINCFGFSQLSIEQGQILYFGDFELVVIADETVEDETDNRVKWTLREGGDISTFYVESGHELTTGVTTASDEPGEGMTYSILDASTTAVTRFNAINTNLGIDASAYSMEDLAVAFWVYAEKEGTLGTGEQFRIGSTAGEETNAFGSNSLIYYYSDIPVVSGWNYITLPLSDWGDDIQQNFTLSSINCFGFSQLSIEQGQILYFGDFELVVIADETVEDETENSNVIATLRAGSDTSKYYVESGHELTTGVTTASDGPGAGITYSILDASSTAVSRFNAFSADLGIDASAYEMEELAVAFWVHAENEETLFPWDSGQLRLGSTTGTEFSAIDGNCLFYYGHSIDLVSGWNYVELPLSEWKTEIQGDFSLASINSFGFYQASVSQGQILGFCDFQLIVLEDENAETVAVEGKIEVTKNISSITENYMILSNVNATDESNQFALYVTQNGYPAVLYGTTQFVLKQSVAIDTDVNIKAVINTSKQVEFYIDGSLVATSKTTVSSIGAPTTAYSIGADGTGSQVFDGTIKDVKVYSDASATTCTGNWPLVGDINYVVETMPDISGNGNDATFKGTRADDWYDVNAISADDGEWSLVFIPDIVQRFYRNEHAIWHKMASWIGDNVEAENIKYVIGAETADSAQAECMNYGYQFFDTAVPTTNLNTTTDNNYYRFSVNGVKWGIISLKTNWVDDYTNVFEWATGIIEQYPYDNIILTCDEYYGSIWGSICLGSTKHVKLIISGVNHVSDADLGGAPLMLLAAQNDLENNYFGEQGLGLLYMLRFTEDGTKVTARSYAPIYDSYFTGVVNYEKTITTVAAPEVESVEYAGAIPGEAPEDIPDGYLFAGWFKPEAVEEWLLYSKANGYCSGQNIIPTSYVTTASDAPGEGMTCFEVDARESESTIKLNCYHNQENALDLSAYSLDELAIEFWVYSNKTQKLELSNENGKAGQLRLGTNTVEGSSSFIYYPMSEIDVIDGWTYVQVPLSSFYQDACGDTFTLSNITTWGIMNSLEVPSGTIFRFGNVNLVRYGSNGSEESALTTATTETVYARFVDKDLLTVKAQIRANTSDASNYSDIRFVTSVDRLEYKKMGFEISYKKDNGATKTITGGATENNIVYKKLYAVSDDKTVEAYTPKQIIAASSEYFKAYTITNVPNRAFNSDFKVRAYWVTMDGTKVYGDYDEKTVWMGYQTNNEFLPVIVNTTYDTDDVVIADVVLNDPKYGYVTETEAKTEGFDWSDALQQALNDVHGNGGGTVYLPEGQYLLTESITIPSYVTLRGDWQNPDDGTAYGTIFMVQPTAELVDEDGNPVNRNDDDAHRGTAAFELNGSSGVNGITVYYPEQSLDSVKKYPYTFYVADDASQLMTLKNITVINGYRGIGTSYKVQHEVLNIDTFKGTFLDCGMALYNASDAGRVTGVSINSEYWKECSLGSADASTYVKNTENVVGMEIGDLEWQQFSNCSVDGYNTGISVVGGYRINFAGSMIDMSITNCTTGITIAEGNDSVYVAGTSGKDSDGDGTDDKSEYPLNRAMDPRWGAVIARSTIKADGNAIVNNTQPTTKTTYTSGLTTYLNYITQTSALLTLTDVEVEGDTTSSNYSGYGSILLGSSTSTYDSNVKTMTADLGDTSNARYDASYVKPTANLWVVDMEEYDGADVDVSNVIQTAMKEFEAFNDMKGYTGGVLYIPGGTYRLDNPIEVYEGIELRGASSSANREQYNDCEGTLFMCYYGDDSLSATGDALITLSGDGAGVNGLRFIYPENVVSYEENLDSTYVINAEGKANVHVTNCFMIASSYGVQLTDCDNFYIEGVYSCVYKNTFNVSGDNGIIRGCLANPNMLVRTSAEGLTSNWPTEASYDDTSAVINTIRNSLKNELTYIKVTGGSVLVQDTTAYAVNTMVSSADATTVVLNCNADCMDDDSTSSTQFKITSGTLTAINALRAAVADDGSSVDTDTAFLYSRSAGNLYIYNSMMAKSTESASAYEDNTVITE